MANQNEKQTVNAHCDCCSNQSTGTEDSLRARGWGFGGGSEFCPECND